MNPPPPGELDDLRRRLEESEETLRAIRSGEVDALVVQTAGGEQIYTLQGADHPYRSLIESMQQGAITLGSDGTVLYCNPSFAEMVRIPHERLIGSNIVEFVVPARRVEFAALLNQATTAPSQGEFQFQSGGAPPLSVYLVINRLLFDEAVTLCMVATDLTEQKKHRGLEEENRRKDEFLAMLAHELRNPLAPIQNAVYILEHLDIQNDQLTYAREAIGRQVQHLTRLVDDLLDVSRISVGKVKLRNELVDLSTVASTAIELCSSVIDMRHHLLTVNVPESGPYVEGDPIRLGQVISNLLANSAKYTNEGGRITLSIEREGSDALIRVTDSGIGIAPDLLPHVFDLFVQGDRSLARSEGGLGIGLTLVRRLVELHGGTVEAHSEGRGMGSQFVIRIPALDEAHSFYDVAPPHQNGHSAKRNQSILVAEDNRDAAASMSMLLKLMGHEVRVAHTGTEALELATTHRPTVLLLDIGLPEMSGYEVAEQLRKQRDFAGTVLIAMTGYGQDEDRRRSKELGFDHHLVKPVDLNALEELLNSL